jgi:hypothetical protein
MAYAYVIPILRGKTDAVRRLTAEILGPRRAEYDDLQRRSGVKEESYSLQQDPDVGDLLIVVGEAGEDRFWDIMKNPQTDFDRWYRDQIEAIWEIDATNPPSSPVELLGTWKS